MTRTEERMLWVLAQIDANRYDMLCAWDAEIVDAFVEHFPEAERTLKVFTLGSNQSPMLNRAAKRAEGLGLLKAGRIGNQDARSFNMRTWCRTWSLTDEGRRYLLGARQDVEHMFSEEAA